MANQFKHLGQEGLSQLLQLLSNQFGLKVDKVAGKDLSTNDFTNELKAKLEGIAEGANKYVHDTFTAQDLAFYKVQTNAEGHVIAVSAVTKGDITALGIPGQDTTYVVATADADGLMSKADFSKLAGIEAGANKYVHATHTEYASGFYKFTVDGEGHVTAATAVTKADLVTLLGEATLTENGLMSAADKTKLEGIAAGAQVNVIEKILVNGTEKEINGKSVDLTIPTGALANKSEVAEADLESALKDKINAAAGAQHTHSNKELLDTYTQTEADLADAVAKKHAHTFNESELNNIKSGDVAKWNAAQANAEATAAGALAAAKTELEGKITEGDNAAKTYAEEKASAAQTAAQGYADGKAATAEQNAKDYADQKIAAQISSAYKAAGSIAFADLPEASESTEGKVYNITDDFTTDADFVEGAGKKYKAGTNVVIVEVADGSYMYDVLAMSFDGFVQEANITEYSADEINALWNTAFGA